MVVTFCIHPHKVQQSMFNVHEHMFSALNNFPRFMPPTTPHPAIAKFAIVFARLIVNDSSKIRCPRLSQSTTPIEMDDAKGVKYAVKTLRVNGV